MESVVAALMEEDVPFALGQLGLLSKAQDEAVASRAQKLLAELTRSQMGPPVEPAPEPGQPDANAEPRCETKGLNK